MAPTKYNDYAKSANDLLNKEYNFDRKLELKHKTSNGVEFTNNLNMSGKGVNGKLTSKFTAFDSVLFKKLGVNTSGRVFAEMQMNDLVDGAQFRFKCEDGGNKDPDGSFGVTYGVDSFLADVDVNVVNGPTVAGSASVGPFSGFTLGASGKFDTGVDAGNGGGVQDYNGAVSYASGDVTATFATTKKASNYNLAVHHQVDSNTAVAATFGFSDYKLAVGGSYRLDNESSVQGKFDSAGVLSGNYIHQISSQVKFTASAQVNATDFAGDSHKFGLGLFLG